MRNPKKQKNVAAAEEVELKFLGPEDALDRVRRLPALRKFAGGRRFHTQNLRSIYYDTPDFALRDHGMILRVREEGDRFIQTVKSARNTNIAARNELNADVPSTEVSLEAIKDKKTRRAVKAVVKKSALIPLFAVEVRRSKVMLSPRRGVTIEASIDHGSIKALGPKAGASVPVSEFELELKKGSPGDLVDAARALTLGLPLTLGTQSKAERGYALVEGDIDNPVKAGSVVLDRKAYADDAFARILTHCLAHLLRNVPCVLRTRDPEGIHQMRVAMRRMRSALSVFGEPFRSSLGELENEIKWLTQTLGEARDLDVFHDTIFKPAAKAMGDDARMTQLGAAVRARRRGAWSTVLDALESDRFRKLALDLGAATLLQPWAIKGNGAEAGHGQAHDFADKHIAKRHARIIKSVTKLEDLEPQERHQLRVRLKKLRYAADFFSCFYKRKPVRSYQKNIAALQDLLGHLNDANVARALIEDVLANEGGDPASASGLAYAGGAIVGWHTEHGARTMKKLARRWKKFTNLEPFWA
ncbi:MAG: CHAD domain-containing protein [Alphaproteobacteria bacterium]|nr:CHAD domain-containing protein [Alphaproteobacteria bacterium]